MKNHLHIKACLLKGTFPKYGYADPYPSVLSRFLWIMRNVLERMKNLFSDFSNFYFSSYRENSSILRWFEYKNDHSSKNKNRKILNLISLSIQPIPHLSCEFEHFWTKNWNFFFFKYWNVQYLKNMFIFFLFFWWGSWPPTKYMYIYM